MIIGTTASGKTKLAAHLAYSYNGEIVSADSRQVYEQLNIGSGKDYDEYIINGQKVKYHLIDVANISEQFYLKDFATDANQAINQIIGIKKLPIICGGTGLYLDALLKNYDRMYIPENNELRNELSTYTNDTLIDKLNQYPNNNNYAFDTKSRKRLIRAIEILHYELLNATQNIEARPNNNPLIIGLELGLEQRKKKISDRLTARLNNGLIEEVEQLLKDGYTPSQMIFLGLEYKFITLYLTKELSYEEMHSKLEIAIHQFAKRQATWFRKIEKEGFQIHWIDANENFETVLNSAKEIIDKNYFRE